MICGTWHHSADKRTVPNVIHLRNRSVTERRNTHRSGGDLQPYENRNTLLDISIPAKADDICFISEQLQRFFLKNGTSPRIAYIAALCTEEIAADYIAYRKSSGLSEKEAYMDIKAFCDPERIEILMKNYDVPYDPLIINENGSGDEDFSKIGVVMAQRVADKILYSYAYHLNVISITMSAK